MSTARRVAEGKTYETCSSAPWNRALSGKRPSDYCRFQSCRHTQRDVLQKRVPAARERREQLNETETETENGKTETRTEIS